MATVTLTNRWGEKFKADPLLYARYQVGDHWWTKTEKTPRERREYRRLARANCRVKGFLRCLFVDPYTGHSTFMRSEQQPSHAARNDVLIGGGLLGLFGLGLYGAKQQGWLDG